MNRNARTKMIASWCVVSMLCTPGSRAADPIAGRPAVRDVALTSDGSLHGSLLLADGRPQVNAKVILRRGADIQATAVTQADGSFTMKQVRPGVYEIASTQSSQAYRVWAARAAPPAAQPKALLVEDKMIARGQQDWSPARRALILSGVIITSGLVGGVIGYNINDDDSAS